MRRRLSSGTRREGKGFKWQDVYTSDWRRRRCAQKATYGRDGEAPRLKWPNDVRPSIGPRLQNNDRPLPDAITSCPTWQMFKVGSTLWLRRSCNGPSAGACDDSRVRASAPKSSRSSWLCAWPFAGPPSDRVHRLRSPVARHYLGIEGSLSHVRASRAGIILSPWCFKSTVKPRDKSAEWPIPWSWWCHSSCLVARITFAVEMSLTHRGRQRRRYATNALTTVLPVARIEPHPASYPASLSDWEILHATLTERRSYTTTQHGPPHQCTFADR